jgi:hypothetical protein
MKQTFKNIDVAVINLTSDEQNFLGIHDDKYSEVYTFNWDGYWCGSEDSTTFHISKSAPSDYDGEYYKGNIRTVEGAMEVIVKFNAYLKSKHGVVFGMERFRLECSSVIEL